MIQPVISVSVTTYNHKSFISQCLDGILMQQSKFPFEIILGEDESNDGTREICIEYANKFPDKIKLFLRHRKDVIYIDGNPTGRFNFIENLKAAKGKYIALCEGDDYWTDPLKLQKQVDQLEDNTNLVASHHWQTIAVSKNGIFVEDESPKDGYHPNDISGVNDIFSNKMRVKSRTILFRNVIDEDFLPDWFTKVAFGDVPLSFLLGKYGEFGFINEKMATYRHTDSGMSKSGLEELGRRKFNIQHFKNWIEIWDYADIHYNYKFHKESYHTIKGFYKIIIDNSPINITSLFKILQFNIIERKMPFQKSIKHGIWLIFNYIKLFAYKFKRKLQKL